MSAIPPPAPQGSYIRRLGHIQEFRASNPAPRQVDSPRPVSSSISTLPKPETIRTITEALIPIFENASNNPTASLEVLEYCFINPSAEKLLTLEKATLIYEKIKPLLSQAEKDLQTRTQLPIQLAHHRTQEAILDREIARFSLTSGDLATDDEKLPDLVPRIDDDFSSLRSIPEENPNERSQSIFDRFRIGYQNLQTKWNQLISSRDSHAEKAHGIEQSLKTLQISEMEATQSVEDLKTALNAAHETFVAVLSTDLKTEQEAQEFLGRLTFAKSLYR